jgi:hypothetical protein
MSQSPILRTPLRTLEGQFGLLGKRMLLSVVWTYGETTGRTLCKPYRWMYVRPLNVRYFLEYLLVNTWTYKVAIKPPDVCPLAKRSLLFWAYKYHPTLFVFCTSYIRPQVTKVFKSVLSVFCERVCVAFACFGHS